MSVRLLYVQKICFFQIMFCFHQIHEFDKTRSLKNKTLRTKFQERNLKEYLSQAA